MPLEPQQWFEMYRQMVSIRELIDVREEFHVATFWGSARLSWPGGRRGRGCARRYAVMIKSSARIAVTAIPLPKGPT